MHCYMKMFCYQCQGDSQGKGCGNSGCMRQKARDFNEDGPAPLHNQGNGHRKPRVLREKGVADCNASHFIIDALFTTITNANFDNAMLDGFIDKGLEMKNELIGTAKKAGNHASVYARGIISHHKRKLWQA